MKYIKLFESFVEESGFYEVPQWDQAGQKYASHYGDLDSAGISTQYKIGDAVKVKTVGSKWDEEKGQYVQTDAEAFGQIITIFKNEETGEKLFGVRIFKEDGMTSLGKMQEDEILGKAESLPDYVLNHEKYEKRS